MSIGSLAMHRNCIELDVIFQTLDVVGLLLEIYAVSAHLILPLLKYRMVFISDTLLDKVVHLLRPHFKVNISQFA